MSKNTKSFLNPIEHEFTLRHPGVRCFSISYIKENYHDDLFIEYNIDIPQTLNNAVTKRRAEFIAGRYCASNVLMLLGCEETKVAVSPERAPVWPAGVLGSISHTDNFAIAVAGFSSKLTYIGIDIEIRQPKIFVDMANEFTSTGEQGYFSSLSLDYDVALLISFSAKESLFKALWPTIKYFFDFSYAEIIDINEKLGKFSLRLTKSLTRNITAGTVFDGRYYYYQQSNHKNSIITFIAK
ncbi:4'-phosphopantetheinyl transferase superfamily protein [Rouxiella badensis]|uniref:4'-phosphopantetheinyl transferase family protein n=2 Tax=Yersiniaceae TaxID=1903411 RepID=UPI001D14588D|nr:4'-phosphopantetheinyl transferase superfamily protein [Rouxiella badensis]MCC3738959.1 4'-phosphopantetheinyl transferase superfamily protein [Rouxiella badensis]